MKSEGTKYCRLTDRVFLEIIQLLLKILITLTIIIIIIIITTMP